MRKDLLIKVIVTSTKEEMFEALMEVKDHGHELRFYNPKTYQLISSDTIKSWELSKNKEK